jgi:hypothetical protein
MKIIHNTASGNDYSTAFPAVFYQQVGRHTTNFETHAVFVLLVRDDFSGRVSESGQTKFSFLNKVNVLLTETPIV